MMNSPGTSCLIPGLLGKIELYLPWSSPEPTTYGNGCIRHSRMSLVGREPTLTVYQTRYLSSSRARVAYENHLVASGEPAHVGDFLRQFGHPVGLSARFRGQLEALRGDEGARSVLDQNAGLVTLIEVDDPGVCRDIDTPDDLRRA